MRCGVQILNGQPVLTPWLRLQRKTNLEPYSVVVQLRICKKVLLTRFFASGPERDRTVDLYTASVALSQLSYGPVFKRRADYKAFRRFFKGRIDKVFVRV